MPAAARISADAKLESVLWKLVPSNQEEFSREEVFKIVHSGYLGGKRSVKQSYQRKHSRTQAKLDKALEELKVLKNQTCFHVVSKRRKKQSRRYNYSLHGGYALALARNCGHGSLISTLNILGATGTRQTLSKWEVLLGANMTVASKSWYQTRNDLEYRETNAGKNTFQLHFFKGDSTNTAANQSLKAHVVEVTSVFSPTTVTVTATDTDDPDDNDDHVDAQLGAENDDAGHQIDVFRISCSACSKHTTHTHAHHETLKP